MFEQLTANGQQLEIGMVDEENRRWLKCSGLGLRDHLLQRRLVEAERNHQHHRALYGSVRLSCNQRFGDWSNRCFHRNRWRACRRRGRPQVILPPGKKGAGH